MASKNLEKSGHFLNITRVRPCYKKNLFQFLRAEYKFEKSSRQFKTLTLIKVFRKILQSFLRIR